MESEGSCGEPLGAADPGFVSIFVIRGLVEGLELREIRDSVVVDLSRGTLEVDGAGSALSLAERSVIQLLTRTPGQVVSRHELNQTLREAGEVGGRKLDTVVNQLRSKLGRHASLIRAHYGIGYSLRNDPGTTIRDFPTPSAGWTRAHS